MKLPTRIRKFIVLKVKEFGPFIPLWVGAYFFGKWADNKWGHILLVNVILSITLLILIIALIPLLISVIKENWEEAGK